jgi:hypothetical protein
VTTKLPHLPVIDGTLFIDNSSFERIVRCPRSAQYYILQRKEADRPTSALSFGRNIHKALEIRYEDPESLTIATPATFRKQVERLREEFDQVPTDDWRSYDRAVETIQAYNEEFAFEPFKVKHFTRPDGTTLPLVELPFAHPIFEMDLSGVDIINLYGKPERVTKLIVVWQGRIDLVVEQNGGLFLLDHKTTSMGGANYFKQFELSHQFFGYTYAMQKILREQIRGFFVNAIVNRRPTKTGTKTEFMRNRFDVHDFHLGEWLQDTISVIDAFVHQCLRSYFPKYTFNCVGKFGLCEYHDACLQNSLQEREIILNSGDFRDVTWDPLSEGPHRTARPSARPSFIDPTIEHLLNDDLSKSN